MAKKTLSVKPSEQEIMQAQGEKFKRWAKLFLDKTNKNFFLNATQSALEAYDTDNYGSASVIGTENKKRLQALMPTILETAHGISFEQLMKVGYDKMNAAGYDEWERFMIFLGLAENPNQKVIPGGEPGVSGNIFNVESFYLDAGKHASDRGVDRQ